MSKNYHKPPYLRNGASPAPEIERPFFYTEDGHKVYIKAISMVELEEAEIGIEKHYRAQGEPLDPPTYTVKVAGGGEVEYPLTADILEVHDNPAETQRRQAAWAAHQAALNRLSAEKGRIIQEIILEGIEADVPEDGHWEARLKRRYIDIPEDPLLKRQKYLLTEVLKTPGDWLAAQNEILLISSSGAIKREAVEAASATFRDQLFALTDEAGGEGSSTENGGGGAQEEAATLGT